MPSAQYEYLIEAWDFFKMEWVEVRRVRAIENPLQNIPAHLRPFYRYRLVEINPTVLPMPR